VIGLAGKLPLVRNDRLQQYFDVLLPIGNGPADMLMALRDTAQNLRRTAGEMGNLLAMGAIKSAGLAPVPGTSNPL
jgi:glycerate kinase